MTSATKRLEGKAHAYRQVALVVVVAATTLVGALAWITRTSAPGWAGPLEPVTLATNSNYAGACPILAAQEFGHFASEGLAATIQPHTSGKSALDAALNGRAELATVSDIPIMFAAMNGQPVSVVASIFRADRDQGIVARKDRGIATPIDLKGKRVGVTLGTSGNFFLDAFINRQKLSANAVVAVDMKPEVITGALLSGEVDAISTWEPYLGMARTQLGSNAAMFYGEGIYEVIFNLAGTRAFVAGHPETVRKVLRAVIRGAQFCKDSPDAASAIVARATDADLEQVKGVWSSYRFKVALDQALILTLEDDTRWAIRRKLTSETEMPNYLDHIDFGALKAVRPSAVTIIH